MEIPLTPVKIKIKRLENKINTQNKNKTPTKNKNKQRKQMDDQRKQQRITSFFIKRDAPIDETPDQSAPASPNQPKRNSDSEIRDIIQSPEQGCPKLQVSKGHTNNSDFPKLHAFKCCRNQKCL